jgi:hypothetical protein
MHCDIGYEPELRARVEMVCMRRQLAFAAKLPNGQKVKAETEWALTSISSDYWTDEAFLDRHVKGAAADVLRYEGASEFLIRTVLQIGAAAIRVRHLIMRIKRAFRTKP